MIFYKASTGHALCSISLAHMGKLEGEVAGSAQPRNIACPSSFTMGKTNLWTDAKGLI